MPSDGTSLDLKRLAQVLGLLQSAHDGEVTEAARRATRMVREAGLTWQDILRVDDTQNRDLYGAQQVVQHPERGPLAPPVGRTWKDTLRWLCARSAGEDVRENEFLDNLARRLNGQYGYGAPFISPYQAAWVTNIYDRIAKPEANA